MTDQELLGLLDKMRAVMISVSTGGPRIGEVNFEFQEDFREVADALDERGIENPLTYSDLWQWHGRWGQDDLPTYASRRVFVGAMFDPLIARIRFWQKSRPGTDRLDPGGPAKQGSFSPTKPGTH